MGRVYEHVAALLRDVSREARVTIEVGCGSCQYAPSVPGLYVGLDRAEHYHGGRADVKGDARALPFGEGVADLVFMVATLCIMPGGAGALAEAHRVLRPGGRLVVFDYSWWSARPSRVNYHTSMSLARRLRGLGMVPRIHWTCAPGWGPGWLRRLSNAKGIRLATYLAGSWVIVSGTKRG